MLVKLRISHQSIPTRQYALIIRIIQSIYNGLNLQLYINLHAVVAKLGVPALCYCSPPWVIVPCLVLGFPMQAVSPSNLNQIR